MERRKVSIYMDADEHEAFTAYARAHDRTLSQLVRAALRSHLQRHPGANADLLAVITAAEKRRRSGQ